MDDIAEQMSRASAEQRSGARTPDSTEDKVFQVENDNDEEFKELHQGPSNISEPERRLIDGKWICFDGLNYLEYVNEAWQKISDENVVEIKTKWEQVGPIQAQKITQVVNGVQMVWNHVAQQWLPDVDINEDFLASYHMNYGAHTDYEKVPIPEPIKPAGNADVKLTKQEKLAQKRKLAEEEAKKQKGWIEEDETKSTKVYVDGLPKTITEEEFIEFMSKVGIIMEDPRNKKPKIKLYKDAEGNQKGDGYCCYLNYPSVGLALQILDGYNYNGHIVSVQRAHFEMKGEFDPTKKKRKLTAEQKKRLEMQNKVLEWKPEKDRAYRQKSDCKVVLKNMFTIEEICENSELVLDLKTEATEMCSRYGQVKHTQVYDSNPEGVITVLFNNVEEADLCVKSLDRVIRKGREISCKTWDGKTKYKTEETPEQKRLREEAWRKFIHDKEDEEESEQSDEEDNKQPKNPDIIDQEYKYDNV